MENFVREENLRLYRRALLESSDEVQRRVLVILLRLLMEYLSQIPMPRRTQSTQSSSASSEQTTELPPLRTQTR
jgi:hypothetical protein